MTRLQLGVDGTPTAPHQAGGDYPSSTAASTNSACSWLLSTLTSCISSKSAMTLRCVLWPAGPPPKVVSVQCPFLDFACTCRTSAGATRRRCLCMFPIWRCCSMYLWSYCPPSAPGARPPPSCRRCAPAAARLCAVMGCPAYSLTAMSSGMKTWCGNAPSSRSKGFPCSPSSLVWLQAVTTTAVSLCRLLALSALSLPTVGRP